MGRSIHAEYLNPIFIILLKGAGLQILLLNHVQILLLR